MERGRELPDRNGGPRLVRPWADLSVSRSRAVACAGAAALLLGARVAVGGAIPVWAIPVPAFGAVVPSARLRSLVGLAAYAAIWLVFSALRALADGTRLARALDGQVSDAERWVFRGRLPTVDLQGALFDPRHLRWYDYTATATHWSFFVVPHATALALWVYDPSRFRRYRRTLAVLLGLALAIYFLLPTDPPWLAPDPIDSPAAAIAYRIMASVGQQLGGGLYRATYGVIGESNPLAAMPSVHFAVTALLACVVWDKGWRWRIPTIVYALAMACSLIYLGEHYVLDVAVGLFVTVYAWAVSERWARVAAVAAGSPPTSPGRPDPADRARAPIPLGGCESGSGRRGSGCGATPQGGRRRRSAAQRGTPARPP